MIKLKVFLDDASEHAIKLLQMEPSQKIWRRVCDLLCARITIFNKRRGNEVPHLLVDTYEHKPNWAKTVTGELKKSLDAVDLQLLKRY